MEDEASFEGADEADGASSFEGDDEADENALSFAVDDEPDENASSFAGADEADEAESAGMMPLSISLYLSKSSFSSSERFSLISLKSVA